MAVSTGGTNPIAVIDSNPMSLRQWIVVALMVALNALDGFDVLSSAFAAPGISAEWGVPREALGIVLSAALVGMGFAHAAGGVPELTAWRFVAGLGSGGMLTATNAVTAESTSKAGRSLSMAIYVIGYPLGGVIGGFAAQTWLLQDYDWRAVFLFGAVVTAAMIPFVMVFVPETP